MKYYDVIIIGAGPAGLMCAEILSKSDKSVLVLEKNEIFGNKVCGGGLTRKAMELLDIPDDIIEHKITRTAVFSRKRKSQTNAPDPFVFTVNRVTFGTWQKDRLQNSSVEIRNNSKVTSIKPDKIIINKTGEYSYKYLVGADGYFSIVRKYLKLPQEKRLIGIQYTVPDPVEVPRLEIHLNAKRFFSWYGWKFPHDSSFAVGCCCDPRRVSPEKLKSNFSKWLTEKEIDVSNAKYESFPISYDYRGYQFNNIFLAGEAAGMASGFTGEGIYQSLVSGKTVAETILDENHISKEMEAVIKYNAIQERILNVLIKAGPFRGWIHELIVMLLDNKLIKAKIKHSFS
ncbi:MAG: NAD(P)/FAD-dependent oxidoreductase [Bacteroidales bacterium]|nr:NAD(P)/FAD-dependent oxidoreductase [Bacteroidales bacterium]